MKRKETLQALAQIGVLAEVIEVLGAEEYDLGYAQDLIAEVVSEGLVKNLKKELKSEYGRDANWNGKVTQTGNKLNFTIDLPGAKSQKYELTVKKKR